MKISDCGSRKIGVVILFATIFPWIINRICSPTYGEWVGFLGNYIGALVSGIISALIAYYVAKFQINAESKRGIRTAIAVVQVILNKINIEYGMALNFKKYCVENNFNVPLNGTYKGTAYTNISDKEWEYIYTLNNSKIVTDLIKTKDDFFTLIEVKTILDDLRTEKKAIDKIKKMTKPTDSDLNRARDYYATEDLVKKVFNEIESKIKVVDDIKIELDKYENTL